MHVDPPGQVGQEADHRQEVEGAKREQAFEVDGNVRIGGVEHEDRYHRGGRHQKHDVDLRGVLPHPMDARGNHLKVGQGLLDVFVVVAADGLDHVLDATSHQMKAIRQDQVILSQQTPVQVGVDGHGDVDVDEGGKDQEPRQTIIVKQYDLRTRGKEHGEKPKLDGGQIE